MRSKNQSVIEKQVTRAVEVFEQLVEAENIRPRLLIVDNPNSTEHGDDVVDEVIEFILGYELGNAVPQASYQIALERSK
jgi:hypothetical protein